MRPGTTPTPLERAQAEAAKAWEYEAKMLRRAVAAEEECLRLRDALVEIAEIADGWTRTMKPGERRTLILARAEAALGGGVKP